MDAVLTLIEQQTDIGLPADADERDTFGAVLYEIGATALWVIAGAFERVQQRQTEGVGT